MADNGIVVIGLAHKNIPEKGMSRDILIDQNEACPLVMEDIVAGYCPPDAVQVSDKTD